MLILLDFFLISFAVKGQLYNFKKYQIENGLSSNLTTSVIQDSKGFVWIGTREGLNRFDGYNFKIFRHNLRDSNSLASSIINCVYEDRKLRLWVGSEKGLLIYNPLTENFTRLKTAAKLAISEAPIRARSIVMDAEDNLWYIAGVTLCKYNTIDSTLVTFDPDKYFNASTICATGNSVWVGTSTGLLKQYDKQLKSFSSFDVFKYSSLQSNVTRQIQKILDLGNGTFLIGTSNNGVKLFDPLKASVKDLLTYNPDHSLIYVRDILKSSEDEYWIATESGFIIYNIKSSSTTYLKREYNNPYSLSNNSIWTLCKDKEGGIWVATYSGGINYCPGAKTPFEILSARGNANSISGNVVREICQDQYGNLWIGTEDAGLNKYDPVAKKFTHFSPLGRKTDISFFNVQGLLPVGDELWIGTLYHGLDVMNIPTGKVIRHYGLGTGKNDLKNDFITTLYQTRSSAILVGTWTSLYIYNRKEDNFIPVPNLNIQVQSIFETKDGSIWICSFGNGIYYYEPSSGKVENFRNENGNNNSLGSNQVNGVFEDNDNNLWFATEDGLSKYLPAKKGFKTFTIDNGLPSNFVFKLLNDEKNNLWISTSKGLACLNPKTENIKVYTTANGLLSDQFNFNSAYKDATGKLYFGTVNGLVSFYPSGFEDNSFIPPVYLTGFEIFNRKVEIDSLTSPLKRSITFTDAVTLKHDQSTFSIEFAALSYASPQTTQYAYILEGLEKDWTYLKKNRSAYYTNVAPGTYTFRVKTVNSINTKNDKETKLIIKILPPFWASPLAYIFYIICSVYLLYFLVSSYQKRIIKKNERREELMKHEKEKEIYQAKIDFFTNVAHEIKTPLTLIKAPLEKLIRSADNKPEAIDNLELMERNTNRLIDLTNQLLDFQRAEMKQYSLHFVRLNLSAFIADIHRNFLPLAQEKYLTYSISFLPPLLCRAFDPDALNKILSNLYSNAVKYAASLVSVHASFTDTLFCFEIKNDGNLIPFELKDKIFEPFYRLEETEMEAGTGIGLAISKSLTELYNGTLELKEDHDGLNYFCLTLPLMDPE
ncbi:MAG: signal transduction histidine kinase [Ferruginibacter sp.]|nr:signal transduction histidine kinase [Ferruginibacter sp.]